jgi:hypothetical protein
VQQQQQFDRGKGSLASDLRNRLNASGATNWQALSDCWAARAGQAAQRGDRASAKSYADYSIAAREGKSVPACHAGESPKVPEPPAPTWVPMPGDDIQARVIEEEKRLAPLIASLQGRTDKAKATAEKKRTEVAALEKKSQSANDPKEKQETDTLLAEARKALDEAREEDRKASEELNKAQSDMKALNDMKARAEQGKAGASSGGKVTQ